MRLRPFVGAMTIMLAASFIFGSIAALSLPSNSKQGQVDGRDPEFAGGQVPAGSKPEVAAGQIPASHSRFGRLRKLVRLPDTRDKPLFFRNVKEAKEEERISKGTGLPGLKLLGTMTSDTSFAFIQDLATARQGQYKIGDTIKGAKIAEIQRARVVLEKDGERVILDLFPGAVEGMAMDEAIVAISPTQKVVSKSGLLKELGNISNVLGMAQVTPSIDGETGKISGFKIDRIKAKSLAEKAGLKNGDIIKAVNGQELNSPQKAIQIYRKVRNRSKVDLDLMREEQLVTLKYKIAN